MTKKYFLLFLLFFAISWLPCQAAVPTMHAPAREISAKKLHKIQRLYKKIFLRGPAFNHPDPYIWMGLFGLGLAFCLSLFSVTLGGIVALAAIACLTIGVIFKLGTL